MIELTLGRVFETSLSDMANNLNISHISMIFASSHFV